MREKEFRIPIPNTNLHISAKQYGDLDKPIVILIHGLTGFMDEHLFYNGARYFYNQGISSLRFNLYDWQQDARKLTDCTIRTHAEDLNVVIEYLKQNGAKSIHAMGHSYGGPTILLANHNQLKSIVLWDPAYGDIFNDTDPAIYVKELNAYRIRWGTDILIGSDMRQEAKDVDWNNLTANTTVPLKIIGAGRGELGEGGKVYVGKTKGPKELFIIENATHGFSEEGVAEELFAESMSWVKKYE